MSLKTSELRGVKTVKGLRSFEDLLWEWIAVQERFFRFARGKDAMWWHNERTSLGSLSGAIWRAGGVVLEEYSTSKFSRSDENDKRVRHVGFGDMSFELIGRKFAVEAKQAWPRLTTNDPLDRITKKMASAVKDVRRSKRFRRQIRFGVVFASPMSTGPTCDEEMIQSWLTVARQPKHWAAAWVFPETARSLYWKDEDRVYPGAAIFIQRADA